MLLTFLSTIYYYYYLSIFKSYDNFLLLKTYTRWLKKKLIMLGLKKVSKSLQHYKSQFENPIIFGKILK